MEPLLIVSAKGSVGRTTLTCLFVCYLRRVARCRVLAPGLAGPACCAHLPGEYGRDAVVLDWQTADLNDPGDPPADDGFVHLLDADTIAGLLSRDDPIGARYYANLRRRLSVAARWFDVCVIDRPALPDLRAECVQALADAVPGPVEVMPGCSVRVPGLANGTYGTSNVRARLDPPLHFIGLPSVTTLRTPFEKAWAKVMETTLREWLIPDRQFPHGYLCLPCLEVIGRGRECDTGSGEWAGQGTGVCECAVPACLNALTRRLNVVSGEAGRSTVFSEVRDA